MGSGVLLAALVVLWFVVLVPMVVTRGDARTARAGVADSGRTLTRRRAVDPVVHAETERVAIDRDVLRTTGELQVDVHAVRRRALFGLIALAAVTLAGAVVIGSWVWAGQLLLDLAVVGYVLVLPPPRVGRPRPAPAKAPPPRAAARPPGRPGRGPRGAADDGGAPGPRAG